MIYGGVAELGLRRHTRNVVCSKGHREFKSHPHRQFSEFGFWANVAEPRLWRGEAENPSCINWRYVLVKIRTYFQENPDADF